MKRPSSLIVVSLVATLIIGLAVLTAKAGDMMPTSSDVKVLLEDDQVRVSEALRKPGTKVPMHTHPTLVAYYFSAAKVKLTSPEGKEAVKDIPAGKVMWFPDGVTHALEIMGDKDQHVLVIEMKK